MTKSGIFGVSWLFWLLLALFKNFGLFSKHYLPASSAIEDLDATLLFFEDIFLEAGAGGASSTLTDLERGWGPGC